MANLDETYLSSTESYESNSAEQLGSELSGILQLQNQNADFKNSLVDSWYDVMGMKPVGNAGQGSSLPDEESGDVELMPSIDPVSGLPFYMVARVAVEITDPSLNLYEGPAGLSPEYRDLVIEALGRAFCDSAEITDSVQKLFSGLLGQLKLSEQLTETSRRPTDGVLRTGVVHQNPLTDFGISQISRECAYA